MPVWHMSAMILAKQQRLGNNFGTARFPVASTSGSNQSLRTFMSDTTSNGWKRSTCSATVLNLCLIHVAIRINSSKEFNNDQGYTICLISFFHEGTYVNSQCKIVEVSKINRSLNYLIPSRAKMTNKTDHLVQHSSPMATSHTDWHLKNMMNMFASWWFQSEKYDSDWIIIHNLVGENKICSKAPSSLGSTFWIRRSCNESSLNWYVHSGNIC